MELWIRVLASRPVFREGEKPHICRAEKEQRANE
jgi:hypothetical protein